MQRIFDEVIDDMLRECQPEDHELIRGIPISRGHAEGAPDEKGWVIDNVWYHANNGVAQEFWARVLELCDRDGIERRAIGIYSGRDRRGRNRYFRGFVFDADKYD